MKKHLTTLLCLMVLFSAIPAEAYQGEPVDYEAVYKIKDEGLNNSEVMDIAWNLTEGTGPRLSSSPGLFRAYEWSSNKLKEWGLENVEVRPWGEFGKGWEVKKSYLAMTAPYYQPLIGIPKAWTPGTNGLIKTNVVYVNIEKDEDFAQYKGQLKGKVVLLPTTAEATTTFEADATRRSDDDLANMEKEGVGSRRGGWSAERIAEYRKRQNLRRRAYAFFKSEGAALVLNTRRGAHGTFFTSNGASYKVDAPEVLPEMEISVEHYNHMIRLMERGVPVEIEVDTKTEFQTDDTKGYNVIAEIPGSDPDLKDEVVMLGAHLDSWFASTGATDNAAGVAVMMEVMRILKATGMKPKRTIRVALWSSEEQGLFGSRNYVKNTFMTRENQPNEEHGNVSAYYNMDNGTGAVRGVYLQGNEMVRPIFKAWLEPFHGLGAKTLTIRNTGGTDHLAFDGVGIPGFQFIQDGIDYGTRTHHSNMDTYERLIPEDLMKNSVIIASFVLHTANRAEKLPRKPRDLEALNR